MATCLVIGGAGFLGSTLVQELVRAGETVTVLDLPRREPLLPFGREVRRIEGDIMIADQIFDAVLGQEFVFHFAGSSIPSTSYKDPKLEILRGRQMTLNILTTCRDYGVRKVIFLSSGTVYGPWRGQPHRESDATAPRSPYAEAKLETEKSLGLFYAVSMARKSGRLAYTVLRPGSAYGPGQNPNSGSGAATTFLFRCLTGRPILIYGRGDVVRDYTFGRDIIDCARQAMRLTTSQVLNVSTQKGTSLLALSEMCFRLTGRTVPREFLAPRESDLDDIILDNSWEKNLFGLRPTPLEEGLKSTLRWLQTRWSV